VGGEGQFEAAAEGEGGYGGDRGDWEGREGGEGCAEVEEECGGSGKDRRVSWWFG
jgi:hypothetical protein